MLWEAGYVIGFTFATIASISHILGFALLYHWKTKLVKQRIILMNFSVCALIGSTLHTTRGIYSYVCKQNSQEIARFFLYTNGLFIGVGLYYTLLMSLLTLDRIIVTMEPYRHDKFFPKQSCKIAVITCFVFSVVAAVIYLIHQDRSEHIAGYCVSLAFTCLLSLFNLVSYAIIFHIINEKQNKILSKKSVRSRRIDMHKVKTPLLINITLIICFIAPHVAILKSSTKLNRFKISCITMGTANAGLIIDALIYIFSTNARNVLNKFMKRFGINL